MTKLQFLTKRRMFCIGLLMLFATTGAWYGNVVWSKRRLSDLERQCRRARVKEDWDRLDTAAAQWTELEPMSGQAWAMRALASQEKGNLPATAAFLERIPDGDATAIPAFIELSGLYFETLRNPLKGEATCRRVLAINPEIVAAHQRLTHYYAMTLQRKLAIEQVKESIRQRAESVSTYCYFVTLPDLVFQDSMTRVESWMEVSPDETSLRVARTLIRARDDSLKSGNDFEKKLFEELMLMHEEEPDNLELLTTLLEILAREGDRETVGRLLENAPLSASDDHRMWRFRSWYAQSDGDLVTAEAHLRQSLRLYPMDWHSWHQLSGLLRQANRIDQSTQAMETAKFGKELQNVLLSLLTPETPPKEALEGILDYAIACGDEFVVENLSRRLKRPILGIPPPLK
jgi:tetratricopeptide (TPR) repeat protein